ncbi:hypothetical protein RRL34_004250 [Vibrio parahaemolyticus]|nr:hypothetical protein [Vibrio parahaemolyticus]
MTAKFVFNNDHRKILSMYGLQVACAYFGLTERQLRHQADKLNIVIPSKAEATKNIADFLKEHSA